MLKLVDREILELIRPDGVLLETPEIIESKLEAVGLLETWRRVVHHVAGEMGCVTSELEMAEYQRRVNSIFLKVASGEFDLEPIEAVRHRYVPAAAFEPHLHEVYGS